MLGSAAELVTGQALDQQPEFVVLSMQFTMLQQHYPQHLLQRCGIVRQGVEVDLHVDTMNDHAASALDLSGK